MTLTRIQKQVAAAGAAVAVVAAALIAVVVTRPSGHGGAAPATSTSAPPPSGAAVPGRRAGHTVLRFVAAQLFHVPASFNAAEAATFASHIDMLSENQGELDRWFPAMRAANPHLIILKYVSGTTSHIGQSFPPSTYLHGGSGQQCEQQTFHNVVMNPADPQWIASRIAEARTPGFDGVFLDVMGISPVTPGYLSCIPINPATGQPFTPAEWLNETTAEAAAVRAALGAKVVISNGLGNGAQFFNPTAPASRLLSSSTGGLAEGWMRDSGRPASQFPRVSAWLSDWRMLAATGSAVVIGMVKMWGPGTPAEVEQWHRFSLATYLLGASATSYYDFIGANTAQANLTDSPEEDVDLGAALGPARQVSSGVWVRAFAQGSVVVNAGTAPTAVPLSHAARTLDGVDVNSTYQVPAHTGDILLNH